MSPKSKPTPRACSVADTLALFGDRYSLAIVRELFYGNHRFVDLVEHVAAPRSVLTSRLSTLVEAGVVIRKQYSERPPRAEYLLTEAGRDLAPVLLALKQWGDRWCRDGQQTAVFTHSCGAELDVVTVCRACRESVHFVELEVIGGSNPPMITPRTGPPPMQPNDPDAPSRPSRSDREGGQDVKE